VSSLGLGKSVFADLSRLYMDKVDHLCM
jgi:hypothetical protein